MAFSISHFQSEQSAKTQLVKCRRKIVGVACGQDFKRKVKKICHMTASHTKASSNDQLDMHEWRNMLSMYIGRETEREREMR